MKKIGFITLLLLITKLVIGQVAVALSPTTGKWTLSMGDNAKDSALVHCKQKGGENPSIYYYDYIGGYYLSICELSNAFYKKIDISLGIDTNKTESVILARKKGLKKVKKQKGKSLGRIQVIQPKRNVKTFFVENSEYPTKLLESLYTDCANHFKDFNKNIITNEFAGLELKSHNSDSVVYEKVFTDPYTFDKYAKYHYDGLKKFEIKNNFSDYEKEYYSIFYEEDIVEEDNTTITYQNITLNKTKEFPTIEFLIDTIEKRVTIKFTIPKESAPPILIFINYKKMDNKITSERLTITGIVKRIDTLVTIPKYNLEYILDDSKIKKFTINNTEISLYSKSKFHLTEFGNINHKLCNFYAIDELGNETKANIYVIYYEADKPKIQLNAIKVDKYSEPYYKIYLNENNKFVLKGKIIEDNLKYLKINDEVINCNNRGEFYYQLQKKQNNSVLQIKAEDIFGNKAYGRIKLKFFEGLRELPVNRDFEFNDESDFILNSNDQRIEISYSAPNCIIKFNELKYDTIKPKKYHFVKVPNSIDFRKNDFEISFKYMNLGKQNVTFGYYFGKTDDKNFYYCYGKEYYLYFVRVIDGEGLIIYKKKLCYDFFEKEKTTEYKYKISGYNNWYSGNVDDPKNAIIISVDNGISSCESSPIINFVEKDKIFGRENGFIFLNKKPYVRSKSSYYSAEHYSATNKYKIVLNNIKYSTKLNSNINQTKDEGNEDIFFNICKRNDASLGTNFQNCISDNNYALIIACDKYSDTRDLQDVNDNAKELRDILEKKYLFPKSQIYFNENITKDSLEKLFTELSYSITNPNSNLLIYYIGHGTREGEILLSDSKKINKVVLYNYLEKFKVKNILTVIDACYSGYFRENNETYSNPSSLMLNSYDKKSRILITSASEKTTTGGVFTKYFVRELNNNTKRYLSIDKAFNSMLGNRDFKIENKSDAPTSTIFDKTNNKNGGTFFFINKYTFKK